MKNHKIKFFLYKQSGGEENNRRRAHTYTELIPILSFKIKYWGLHYFYSVHD